MVSRLGDRRKRKKNDLGQCNTESDLFRFSDMSRFDHFVEAQNPVIESVRAELGAGRKRTHWMWFVFPQLRGLGSSAMADHYALDGLPDAKEYLAHPVLGPRLEECSRLVLAAPVRSAEELMGHPDHLKLHASMTLFAQVAPKQSVYHQVLRRFWSDRLHEETMALVQQM